MLRGQQSTRRTTLLVIGAAARRAKCPCWLSVCTALTPNSPPAGISGGTSGPTQVPQRPGVRPLACCRGPAAGRCRLELHQRQLDRRLQEGARVHCIAGTCPDRVQQLLAHDLAEQRRSDRHGHRRSRKRLRQVPPILAGPDEQPSDHNGAVRETSAPLPPPFTPYSAPLLSSASCSTLVHWAAAVKAVLLPLFCVLPRAPLPCACKRSCGC